MPDRALALLSNLVPFSREAAQPENSSSFYGKCRRLTTALARGKSEARFHKKRQLLQLLIGGGICLAAQHNVVGLGW